MTLSYGRIAKIAAQLSNGLVNSAMGQIPCSTERISSYSSNMFSVHIITKRFPTISHERFDAFQLHEYLGNILYVEALVFELIGL